MILFLQKLLDLLIDQPLNEIIEHKIFIHSTYLFQGFSTSWFRHCDQETIDPTAY